MQIETTVHKAALLRLGYYLGGGTVGDQQIDRVARDAIGEALGAIAGVRVLDGGTFAITPANVGQQAVTLELDTAQITHAVHKLRDGQWPALSDVQLDLIGQLTSEVDAWLKQAQAEDTWLQLPKEARARVAKDKE